MVYLFLPQVQFATPSLLICRGERELLFTCINSRSIRFWNQTDKRCNSMTLGSIRNELTAEHSSNSCVWTQDLKSVGQKSFVYDCIEIVMKESSDEVAR